MIILGAHLQLTSTIFKRILDLLLLLVKAVPDAHLTARRLTFTQKKVDYPTYHYHYHSHSKSHQIILAHIFVGFQIIIQYIISFAFDNEIVNIIPDKMQRWHLCDLNRWYITKPLRRKILRSHSFLIYASLGVPGLSPPSSSSSYFMFALSSWPSPSSLVSSSLIMARMVSSSRLRSCICDCTYRLMSPSTSYSLLMTRPLMSYQVLGMFQY